MLNRAIICAVALCCVLGESLAWADTATDQVREGIALHTKGQIEVTKVTPTAIPGIFEVIVGGDVYYSDATGRYAFVDGRLVDTQEKKDLTQPTLDALNTVDFKSLPLGLAVKSVNGNGKRAIAVFEDPACPICRSLQSTLAQLEDVTIYSFTLPIISEKSIPAAIATLCIPENLRPAQWHAYMLGAPVPESLPPGCEQAQADVGRILALGDQLRIHNTPTLILGNGKRIVGGIPAPQLAAALDELGQ